MNIATVSRKDVTRAIERIMLEDVASMRPWIHEKITDITMCDKSPLDFFGSFVDVLKETGTKAIFEDIEHAFYPKSDGEYYHKRHWRMSNAIALKTPAPRVYVHEIAHAVQEFLGYRAELRARHGSVGARVYYEVQACVSECLITGSDISYVYAHWILNKGKVTKKDMLKYIKEIKSITNFVLEGK